MRKAPKSSSKQIVVRGPHSFREEIDIVEPVWQPPHRVFPGL